MPTRIGDDLFAPQSFGLWRHLWLKQVHADTEIAAAFRTAFALADHLNKKSGSAWPSQKTLAEQLGDSERTVRNNIRMLCECGHLEMKRRFREVAHYRAFLVVEGKVHRSDTWPGVTSPRTQERQSAAGQGRPRGSLQTGNELPLKDRQLGVARPATSCRQSNLKDQSLPSRSSPLPASAGALDGRGKALGNDDAGNVDATSQDVGALLRRAAAVRSLGDKFARAKRPPAQRQGERARLSSAADDPRVVAAEIARSPDPRDHWARAFLTATRPKDDGG